MSDIVEKGDTAHEVADIEAEPEAADTVAGALYDERVYEALR